MTRSLRKVCLLLVLVGVVFREGDCSVLNGGHALPGREHGDGVFPFPVFSDTGVNTAQMLQMMRRIMKSMESMLSINFPNDWSDDRVLSFDRDAPALKQRALPNPGLFPGFPQLDIEVFSIGRGDNATRKNHTQTLRADPRNETRWNRSLSIVRSPGMIVMEINAIPLRRSNTSSFKMFHGWQNIRPSVNNHTDTVIKKQALDPAHRFRQFQKMHGREERQMRKVIPEMSSETLRDRCYAFYMKHGALFLIVGIVCVISCFLGTVVPAMMHRRLVNQRQLAYPTATGDIWITKTMPVKTNNTFFDSIMRHTQPSNKDAQLIDRV